jgi:hypothetical protein
MKTYWGSGDIDPRFRNLETRWRRVVRFKTRSLYFRVKSLHFQIDRGLVGAQSRTGCGGEEKNFHHCPCRELNPGRPTRSLVTTLSELPWLWGMQSRKWGILEDSTRNWSIIYEYNFQNKRNEILNVHNTLTIWGTELRTFHHTIFTITRCPIPGPSNQNVGTSTRLYNITRFTL